MAGNLPAAVKEEWPKEMRIRQVSLSERKDSQISRPSLGHLPSITGGGRERRVTYKSAEKRPTQDATEPATGLGKGAESKSLSKEKRASHETGGLLIGSKEKRASQVHRELRTKKKLDPQDRAELFIMQNTLPKWRSHWTGPL